MLHTPFDSILAKATENIPLKEMDSSLLMVAIRDYYGELSYSAGIGAEALDRAVTVASIAHAQQTRRYRGKFTNTPYIEHPLRNTLRLLRAGVRDSHTLTACVLHDVVEDAPETLVEINYLLNKEKVDGCDAVKNIFGERVAYIVEAVTNKKPETPLQGKEKQKFYADHVVESLNSSLSKGEVGVLLVKLSDLVDNASSLLRVYQSVESDVERQKIITQAEKYKLVVPTVVESVRLASNNPQYQSYCITWHEVELLALKMADNLGKLLGFSSQ